MGNQVFFHVLLRVQRGESWVGHRGDRVDGDIHRVCRGQHVHCLGCAPVPRNAHCHQLFPAQPHRGRPTFRRHHARPGLCPDSVRLAIRRLNLPAVALFSGTQHYNHIIFCLIINYNYIITHRYSIVTLSFFTIPYYIIVVHYFQVDLRYTNLLHYCRLQIDIILYIIAG